MLVVSSIKIPDLHIKRTFVCILYLLSLTVSESWISLRSDQQSSLKEAYTPPNNPAIARVPDCVQLLPFEQLREAFNSYGDATTAIGLVRLHRANALFPDVYFQYYGEHFTIMGLRDPTIQFGTADEFVGGYLVRRHVTASGRKAHAMLPPEYMQGATRPIPSPTYTYRPCGTGVLGEQPLVHIVYMAAMGMVLPSPQRFCIGEAPAVKWSFDDVPVPWILPKGYRNPDGTVAEFPGDDNQAEGSPDKGSGTAPGGPTTTSEN